MTRPLSHPSAWRNARPIGKPVQQSRTEEKGSFNWRLVSALALNFAFWGVVSCSLRGF